MYIWKQLAAYAREAVKFISTRWMALDRGVRIPIAAILALILAFSVAAPIINGGHASFTLGQPACVTQTTPSIQSALAVAKANAAAAVVIKAPATSKAPAKPKPKPKPKPTPPPAPVGCPSGNLTQYQLEELWVYAGGNPKYELIASAIAEAESSGYQYAADYDSNGSVDRGYWQINSCWGSLSSYNALENARAAIYISDDGTDWWPWVTYQTGAYLRYM